MASSQPPIPPLVIFFSFMVVATGYLITSFFWGGSLLLLVSTDQFFPEAHRVWSLPNEQFKDVLATQPEVAVPISLFWCAFFCGIIGSVIAGMLVVRTAPFARYGHVIFTATLVAISWLQRLISSESPKEYRWMILVSMFAMVGAMLLGGRIAWRADPPETVEMLGEK